MNLTERDIRLTYRYTELSYIPDVYAECELRANISDKEYEGLKPGEFRFDYESWSRRLGYTKKQMERAIKELSKIKLVIIQVEKGKRGSCSKYFLARFEEKKKENNQADNRRIVGEELSLDNTGFAESSGEQKEIYKEKNEEKKKAQSSQYNNLNIISNIYSSDSIEYRLAEFLFKDIRKNDPKMKEPNFQKWAKDINLIIRLDKREPEEIKEVIQWCQESSFWKSNILSPGKLRKQYSTLLIQMKNQGAAKKEAAATVSLESKLLDMF